MLTENSTIKIDTALDAKMQKELSRGPFRLSMTFMITGGLGCAVFFVLEILSVFFESLSSEYFFVMLVVFAALLGGGIGLKILINKNMKAVTVVKTNRYEFFDDYFTLTEILNGEEVGTAKVYCNQIIKSWESKNYLFLYISAGSAYPVAKSGLSEEELNTLRKTFKIKGAV